MTDHPIFDHVALAVHRWADGFPLLIEDLGGAWCRGGVAGDFAPCQLAFEDDMKVELVEPGEGGGGFVTRFLDRSGPGPHHITFKVPDLDAFIEGCRALGMDILPGHIDLPGRREAFVHPRESGLGTLLQAIEDDGSFDERMPAPAGFPVPTRAPRRLVWVALSVENLGRALALFQSVLGGRVTVDASADRGSWGLVEWEPGRRLLVLGETATPVVGRGDGGRGVDHLLFSEPGASVPSPWESADRAPIPSAASLGVHVELLADEAAADEARGTVAADEGPTGRAS